MIKAIKTTIFVILLISGINVYSASSDLIEPQKDPWAAYEVLYTGRNQITLKVNGETLTVTSRFSMPNGTWNPDKSSTGYFNHTRTVDPRKGYIHITDTFTNLTAGPLPLRQRHTCNLAGRVKNNWIAGRTITAGSLMQSNNPTSYATTDMVGIGFMPVSDEMLIHVKNSISDLGILGLADDNCVIPSVGTYSAEWVIVPTQRPHFWDFVNACRRIRDVNFTLNHQFAFVFTTVSTWDDNKLIEFIRNKSANVVSANIHYYNGHLAHGTEFQKLNLNAYALYNDRIRRLLPYVKPVLYFHANLDASDPADLTAYQDDRTLLSDGTQGTYGVGGPRIFHPIEKNGRMNNWGLAMVRNVESILGIDADDCRSDGIFWDGFNNASDATKYHYGEPWDNISGDIDEATGSLVRLKSSTLLLSREWIVNQMKRMMKKGPLLSNHTPYIRTIYNLHFQAFVETWSDMSPIQAILYSPVALGNRNTEINVLDAYRVMINSLNYGCLYNWYRPEVVSEYETLTKYMFPITPIELREGYIIGKERIVTNRSGTYGWGDNSVHEVHIFGADARELSNIAPFKTTKKIGGKTYTELRLGVDMTAAIVRRSATLPWLILLLGE